MFCIDKVSPMLTKNELTSNIYKALPKLLKDFHKNILGRVILVIIPALNSQSII